MQKSPDADSDSVIDCEHYEYESWRNGRVRVTTDQFVEVTFCDAVNTRCRCDCCCNHRGNDCSDRRHRPSDPHVTSTHFVVLARLEHTDMADMHVRQ